MTKKHDDQIASHIRKLSINRIVKENKSVEYKKGRLFDYRCVYTVQCVEWVFIGKSSKKNARTHTHRHAQHRVNSRAKNESK